MSATVTYAELLVRAKAMGWHVLLYSYPGGPALITGKPSRLSAIRVTDQNDDEVGFVYIHPKHGLDEAASLLVSELREEA
jgi:hypothetical protein